MRIIAFVILLAAGAHAQSYQDVLLPQPRHIVGIVSDQNGKPVPDASIDYSHNGRQLYRTDSLGKFELATDSPVLVVRKEGFRSGVVQTRDAGEVQVTLQSEEARAFPVCSSSAKYDGIDGWGASFQFPRITGVKVNAQGRDIDYGARSYYLDTKTGPKGIRHGSGPMWSLGTPSDLEVWRSIKYEETAYSNGVAPIVDARGQLLDGTHWRYLGKFGESASYSGVDEATALILDRFLDGACLKPTHK
jgi:hypothetical protein